VLGICCGHYLAILFSREYRSLSSGLFLESFLTKILCPHYILLYGIQNEYMNCPQRYDISLAKERKKERKLICLHNSLN
jgi:hypothetical protein